MQSIGSNSKLPLYLIRYNLSHKRLLHCLFLKLNQLLLQVDGKLEVAVLGRLETHPEGESLQELPASEAKFFQVRLLDLSQIYSNIAW